MDLTVRKCGDGFVITFPRELAAQLSWESGDILTAEVAGSGLKIERTMTAHDHTMEIARELMDKYHDTLAALAKS